jgi:hypothetical protein
LQESHSNRLAGDLHWLMMQRLPARTVYTDQPNTYNTDAAARSQIFIANSGSVAGVMAHLNSTDLRFTAT